MTPVAQVQEHTEEEKALFKLKRQAIRRSLKSLEKKIRKVKRDRFRKEGAMPGLHKLRGQVTALIVTSHLLRGKQAPVPYTKDGGLASESGRYYQKWLNKYREMYLA